MKYLTTLLVLLTVCQYLTAAEADTLDVNSTITDATVYYKGATITRSVELSAQGTYVVAIKGIPQSIDKESLTLKADNNLEIKSVKTSIVNANKFDTEYYNEIISPHNSLRDSIELLTVLIGVLDEEYKMIASNQNFEKGEEITSVEEVIMASEFYQSRVKKLKLDKMKLGRELSELQGRKAILDREAKEYRHSLTNVEMVIYVSVDASTNNSSFELSYFSNHARWSPFYDLKAGKEQDKIDLHRKAFVSQYTGEEWNDINLSLSTASPTSRNTLPVLEPKRLQSRPKWNQHTYNNQMNKNMTGIVIDDTGQPLIGANILINGVTTGTVTDINGEFYLPAAINKNVEVFYTGYNTCTFYINNNYNTITLKEGSLLDEVVVTGSRMEFDNTTSGAIFTDGVPLRKEIQLEIKETLNSLTYELSETYTVTSGSEPIDVLLTTERIPTELKYESIPLESETAFLFAEIMDWHLYDLEPAPVNLFIDDTYKGKTRLDPDSQKDGLRISLGSDPEVSVSRKWINDKYEKKFLSRQKQQKHHYAINIKNNKEDPISIKIKDLIPISSDEAIKIEEIEISGAKLEEETGILTWNLELDAGESKTLQLVYKLKYPKNYDINI